MVPGIWASQSKNAMKITFIKGALGGSKIAGVSMAPEDRRDFISIILDIQFPAFYESNY